MVDGTETYATVAQQAVNEVTNLFITSSTVHLSRNPRECLGECQKMVEPNTLVNLGKNWTKFTQDMFAKMKDDFNSTAKLGFQKKM